MCYFSLEPVQRGNQLEVINLEPLEGIVEGAAAAYANGTLFRSGDIVICAAPKLLRKMFVTRESLVSANAVIKGLQHTVNLHRFNVLNGRIALRIIELVAKEHMHLLEENELKQFKVTKDGRLIFRAK